jgi:hypothetical protein
VLEGLTLNATRGVERAGARGAKLRGIGPMRGAHGQSGEAAPIYSVAILRYGQRKEARACVGLDNHEAHI